MVEREKLIKYIEELFDDQYEQFYCVISSFVNKMQGTDQLEFEQAMAYIFKNYDETLRRLSGR